MIDAPFGSFAASISAALLAYILLVLTIGWRARAARLKKAVGRTESLDDFYLAGRGLSGVVLLA